MSTDFQRELRTLRGLRTQEQFAELIGVSRATVAAWDCGRAVPSLSKARDLVRAGMDPAIVLDAVINKDNGVAA